MQATIAERYGAATRYDLRTAWCNTTRHCKLRAGKGGLPTGWHRPAAAHEGGGMADKRIIHPCVKALLIAMYQWVLSGDAPIVATYVAANSLKLAQQCYPGCPGGERPMDLQC